MGVRSNPKGQWFNSQLRYVVAFLYKTLNGALSLRNGIFYFLALQNYKLK